MSRLVSASFSIGKKNFSCKYPSCKNGYFLKVQGSGFKNKTFHTFPKDPLTLSAWKSACRVSPSKDCSNFRICEDHFCIYDFDNPDEPTTLKCGSFPQSPFKCQLEREHNYAGGGVARMAKPRILFPNTACTSNDHSNVTLNPKVPLNSDKLNQPDLKTNNNTSFQMQNEVVAGPSTEHDLSNNPSCYEASDSSKNSSTCSKMDTNYFDEYSFLLDKCSGILSKAGIAKCDLSPEQEIMYQVHRNTTSKLSRLRKQIKDKNSDLTAIKNLYNDGKFKFIEENLNDVSKEFINSQLRNVTVAPSARRWSIKDKAFALSIYKRSPRLYRYLRAFFQLPSIRTLQHILASIPFESGVINPILEHLKLQFDKMDELDRCCSLMFDEMSLSSGLYYERHKQKLCGYEDLGPMGTTSVMADHALVFMIRGVRKSFKTPVAFFFTNATVKSETLKSLILLVINELQKVGCIIVATVCDQAPTNQAALGLLTKNHTDNRPTSYHFVVNDQPIVTIFDVPHLLKCTRNCLINCNIEFEPGKFAKMCYIKEAFQADISQRTYRCLPKLKESNFNFGDTFMKMRVNIAARQLSHSMAAAIETFYTAGIIKESQSLHTAEFAELIDNLFDSLNSTHFCNRQGKKFRCALSDDSPHLEFWSNMLPKLSNWRIFENNNGSNGKLRNNFSFVNSWQVTIRAVIYLWNILKGKGLKYLNLRSLNQDPVENLFGQIRQHGVCNTNPTCHQFIAALKTVIVNNLSAPISGKNNCEEDFCKVLGDFGDFLNKYSSQTIEQKNVHDDTTDIPNVDVLFPESNYATAYVAGYVLKKLDLHGCEMCHQNLFSKDTTEKHLFVAFKENDEKERLKYASNELVSFLDLIHLKLFPFLISNGHKVGVEARFKELYLDEFNKIKFCSEHDCIGTILDIVVPLTIYKYIKDNKKIKGKSEGHFKKMKIFSESRGETPAKRRNIAE